MNIHTYRTTRRTPAAFLGHCLVALTLIGCGDSEGGGGQGGAAASKGSTSSGPASSSSSIASSVASSTVASTSATSAVSTGTGGQGSCTEAFTGECSACVQASCCAEVAACDAVPTCLDCLLDPTDCAGEVLLVSDPALECITQNCGIECEISSSACGPPSGEVTGSCSAIGGDLQCNVITNEGCPADMMCGVAEVGTSCFPLPAAPVEACGSCGGGAECGPGQLCLGNDLASLRCNQLCCSDTECPVDSTCDTFIGELLGIPGLGTCKADFGGQIEGDACASAQTVDTFPFTAMGTTVGAPEVHDGGCTSSPSGGEVVYRVVPATSGTLTVIVDPGASFNADPVVYLRTSCGDPLSEIDCTDVPGVPQATESLSTPVVAGVPVFVFVDGWGVNNASPYSISIELE